METLFPFPLPNTPSISTMAFTIIETSVGALFIQLATTNYYLQLGSTIGFSSIISNTILKKAFKNIPFIIGIVSSALVVKNWIPQFLPDFPTSNLSTSNVVLFSIAGFLVGLGTKLGAGCTSGHMIGGLSRLRIRSLVAVATFSSTAIALNKILGLGLHQSIQPNYQLDLNWNFFTQNKLITSLLIGGFIQVYGILPYISRKVNGSYKCLAGNYVRFLSGFLFGIGLHVSGMINVSKTIGFLSILDLKKFDPSLLMIMIFTVLPNIFIWKKIEKPLLVEKFDLATSNNIPPTFLIGNVLFGLGWGLLGICPGPGLINTIHFKSVAPWLLSFLGGQQIGSFI